MSNNIRLFLWWMFVAIFLVPCLLVAMAGCATVHPPADVMVQYQMCDGKDISYLRLKVTDTNTPFLDCFNRAGASGKAKMLVLTMLGFPPLACAIRWPKEDGQFPYGEIYVAEDGAMAAAISAVSLHSTEGVLEHELEHITGMRHTFLWAFGEQCGEGRRLLTTEDVR